MKLLLAALLLLLGITFGYANERSYTPHLALSILKEKSKDAYFLASSSLSKNYGVDGAKVSSNSFSDYIEDGSRYRFLQSISTAVHESSHLYTDIYALKYMEEHFGKVLEGDFFYYYVGNGHSIFVQQKGHLLPSTIAPLIPEKLRLLNYAYLIPEEASGYELPGVYGLLDEMNAYYWGSQVTYDLFYYYTLRSYSAGVFEYLNHFSSYTAMLEFRLYILASLSHAEKNNKKAYKAIITNSEFCRAFRAVDRNSSLLISSHFKQVALAQKKMSKDKVVFREGEYSYTIEYPDATSLEAVSMKKHYKLLIAEMAKAEYLRVLAALQSKVEYPAYP